MAGKEWARANLFQGGGGVAEAPSSDPCAWLGRLRLGPSQMLGVLEMWPLIHPDALLEPDLLAPEAIAAGLLDVREKGGGTVQELIATNRAPRPVILFEGEILLGAKQNRMVAHTVVIAPGATIVIPVGCVERGRWQWTAPGFSASDSVAEAALRRSAKASVAAARASSGRVALDQHALWNEVDLALDCEGVRSQTSDYHAVQRQRAAAEAAFTRITPLERQVGVMAVRDGVLVALDLVGSSGTWRGVSGRIVRSLLATRGGVGSASGPGQNAEDWLAALNATRMVLHPAIGGGKDVTLEGRGLIGSGVWLDSRPAHLSAFSSV